MAMITLMMVMMTTTWLKENISNIQVMLLTLKPTIHHLFIWPGQINTSDRLSSHSGHFP